MKQRMAALLTALARPPRPCPNCAQQDAEIQRLLGVIDLYEATRTTGGPTFRKYRSDGTWTNGSHAPPPSANDPTAPPLRRKATP